MASTIKISVSKDLLLIKHQALHNGKYTDCTFSVGKDKKTRKTLHAMKSMLMMASEVFEAMFNSPLHSPGAIHIADSSPEAFSHFLDFLHLAQFFSPITFEDAVEVLVLSDKYLIEPLRDHCIEIIETLMTEAKIWKYLNKHLALTINHVQAEKACIKMLTTNTCKCIENPSFLEASEASVIFMLKQDNLNVSSEKLLFDRCYKWAENQENQITQMRNLLPYLRLRTMTQEQVSLLSEQCVMPMEKLALLKDLCCKSKKRKAEALSEPFSNSLKKRVQTYTDSRCTIIPSKLMTCVVENLAYEDKHRVQCKSVVNYLDIKLKKDIFITELVMLCRIDDLPRIEFHPGNELYQNVPQDLFYTAQLFVKCLSFDDYNLKKGELANYNSSMNNKFSKPMALPKGASFTLCVTVKTTDIGSSYYRKFDADLLRTNLDTYCKKSDVFQSIQIRAERAPVFIKSFNYTIKN